LTDLAVIALRPGEHKQLAAIWKFYPFSGDIAYHYLYPGSRKAYELPSRANFHSVPIPPRPGYQAIREYLAGQGITRICFASLESQEQWSGALGQPCLTVYEGRHLSLADAGSFTEANDALLAQILKGLQRHPAFLGAETGQFNLPENCSVYKDYGAFRKACYGELLVTRNRDLIAAVCGGNIANYTVRHISTDMESGNLAINEEEPDFLLTLTKLKRWERSATRPEGEDAAQRDAEGNALSSYSLFAQYYDSYMSHVNYEEWVDLMLSWCRRVTQKQPKKVLELACGTANASEILAFRKYSVDACDSSPFMLHMADAKVFKPKLYYATLTDPIPESGYDFAFCLFDSINYLTHKADVKKLLANVHDALAPGGVFIFDISTLLNSLQNFNDTTNFTRVRDGYLIQLSNYEALTNRQITKLVLFRQNQPEYLRLEERHVQRVYRTPELVELCAASNLKLKAIFAPEMKANLLQRPGNDLDNRYYRLFFLLRKDS
jgi:SAM-dependent methyltransferase